MKTIQQLAKRDYLILEADWTAAQAIDLLAAFHQSISYIIIHRVKNDQTYFYLYSLNEAGNALYNNPPQSLVERVLDLHEWRADETRAANAPALNLPDRFVVVEDGAASGYFVHLQHARPPQGLESLDFTAPSGPTTPPMVERTLQADFPASVPLNQTASLAVYLTSAPTPGGGLSISQPVGTELDVIIQARRGLTVEGKSEAKLTVTQDAQSQPLQFTLRAASLGTGDVRVMVFREGAAIGYLKLAPEVTAAQAPVAAPPPADLVHQAQNMAPVSVAQPDLSMHIEEAEDAAGQKNFTLWLTASDSSLDLNLKKFGPVTLQSDPGPYFGNFYHDIESLPFGTPQQNQVTAAELAAKGLSLFHDLFSPELQNLLWSIKDRVQSVFIQSSEPWIPWELCKLSGMENGQIVEGPFFCEAFEITRWIPGSALKPVLKLSNLAVVVPSSSGLANAAAELDYLLTLSSGNRHVTRIPARYLDVLSGLSSGKFDGWHFSGHGAFNSSDPNRSEMRLDNQETFTPQRISGTAANLGLATPLVFLNACKTAQAGMALTDAGGWARQFVSAGAGAFIGAAWSIPDATAYQFACELYKRLLDGLPIGKAVREARLAVKSSGDPTWLAYTVFAHPLARIA